MAVDEWPSGAEPAPAPHGAESSCPTLLLASVSSAGTTGFSPVQQFWDGLRQLQGRPSETVSIHFAEQHATTLLLPPGKSPLLQPTPESAQAMTQQAPCSAAELQPQQFHLSGHTRHGSHTHILGPRHLDVASTAGLFTLLHHTPALLSFIAASQQHAFSQLAERVRNFRPRNPFRRNRHAADGSTGGNSYQPTHRPHRAAQRFYETARALERSLDPIAAAEAFTAAAAADPRQVEWLSLAAKSWSDASYLDWRDTARSLEYNSKAVELASQAAELAPMAAHPYIARCVSRGRLALVSDTRTKVAMAKQAADDAAKALELEPHNDLAHHLMGRWHYEMAGLNAIARTLVRLLFGTALMQGSYSAALEHYKTAAQLSPCTMIHRVEFARTLAKLGHTGEAVQQLQHALTCDVDDLNAHLQKLDAQNMLTSLNRGLPAGFALYQLPDTPNTAALATSTSAAAWQPSATNRCNSSSNSSTPPGTN